MRLTSKQTENEEMLQVMNCSISSLCGKVNRVQTLERYFQNLFEQCISKKKQKDSAICFQNILKASSELNVEISSTNCDLEKLMNANKVKKGTKLFSKKL